MCVKSRQKALDYLYPFGLPVNYGWYMIDIKTKIFEPEPIQSNPYSPSCIYNQWNGLAENVCFSKHEMDFYLDIACPRIKTYLDNNNSSMS